MKAHDCSHNEKKTDLVIYLLLNCQIFYFRVPHVLLIILLDPLLRVSNVQAHLT